MELKELFEMQKKLDEHIIEEKGLEWKDLLPKKILALQVELGELANELPEIFKFWSNKKNDYEKALKEYVDCLHFALSIGCDIGYEEIDKSNMEEYFEYSEEVGVVEQLIALNWLVGSIFENKIHYEQTLFELIDLGKKLDFTWEQIVQAYIDKNKVNHKRQENGY